MQLLTAEVSEALARFPLGSQESLRDQARVVVKFFFPAGRYTFLVTEAERQEDGDYLLFGYCLSPFGADCDEWGYAMLSELAALKVRGLTIERDLCVSPDAHTVRELLDRAAA
ncbi:MAG TPA: DUF2958 domain-containing protein [Thermoanaerobaculia bacterium]